MANKKNLISREIDESSCEGKRRQPGKANGNKTLKNISFHSLFLWTRGAFLGCALLCSSCASTYKFNGQKVRVHDNSPRKYGFVLAVGFGLGEQFKKPSR